MQIEYKRAENAIVIDDKMRSTQKWVNVSLGASLFLGAAKTYDLRDMPYEPLDYLYPVLLAISLFALCYGYFRKVSDREIPVDRIKRLRIRRIFGNYRFSFLLADGKVRDLPYVDTEVDRNRLLRISEEAGIPH